MEKKKVGCILNYHISGDLSKIHLLTLKFF